MLGVRNSGAAWFRISRRPLTFTIFLACVALSVSAGLVSPASAVQKPHSNDPVNAYWGTITPGGNGCSDCHSLQAGQGDTATAYISVNARTLGTIRTVTAGAIPANLGCTFCHDRTTSPAKMKGALAGHFDSQKSQHPVGRTFVGGYTDTQNEYLSSYLSNTANEMDCLDCHDPAQVAPSGYYMAHNPTDETNNPYMLKANGIAGVTVTLPGQYDAFCRDCHGTSAAANWKSKGKDIRLVSHKDGRDATATYAIAERDGTLLRTTDVLNDGSADVRTDQCTDCHGIHSAPNAKLFVSAYTNGTDCTSSCHLPGDRYNNYYKHGHGKQTPYATESVSIYEYGGLRMDMAMACTECHTGIDTTTPNSAGTRKPHAEKLAINGDRDNYKANFNLVKNVNIGDPGAPTGNPEWGICIACHSPAEYKAHVSDMDPTATITACQDCHDEHGEGAGTTSNIFMIPETSKGTGFFKAITRTPPATEQVRYLTPYYNTARTAPSGGPYDFYRADGMGSCDNMECHGTTWTANNPGPLSVLMGTGPADTHHSNGYQAPGADCNQCHTHKDTAGGWRAVAACDDCHNSAAPPNPTGIARTHTDPSESKPIHDLHANSTQIVGGCTACHSHDGKTSSADHMNGTVNFGGAKLAATQNYSVSAFPDTGCTAANGCHDAEAGEWASANRLGALQTGCVNCHDAGTSGVVDKDLDQGGWPVPTKAGADKHTLHNASTYVPGEGVQTYHCADCHGDNADLGNHAGHVNGSNTVANSGTNVDVTGYQSADKTCTNYCHVVGLGVVAKRWTTGVLVCVDCHAGTYVGGGANMPTSGLHAGVPTVSGRTHDGSFLYNNGGSTASCDTCHSATPTTPATAHQDGVLATSYPTINFAGNVVFVDGTPPTCAPTLGGCHTDQATPPAWARKWSASAMLTNGTECANCHGGSPTDAAPSVWTAWTTNAGTLVRPLIPSGPGATTQTHAYDWDGLSGEQVQGTHSACKTCHGMNSPTDVEPAYNVTVLWGAPGFHGNGSIDMNGPSADDNGQTAVGAEYNGNVDGTLETSDYSCTKACHQGAQNVNRNMGDSGWPLKYGDYGSGNCNGCHGTTGANYYPDSGAQNGSGYENRAGAHQKHVAVIVARNAGTATADASSCNWCHPGGGHSGDQAAPPADLMNGTSSKFKTITGGTDTDGGFVSGTSTCTNIDCHSGVTTPGWYYSPDTAAPVWTPNSGISATNPNQGGVLNVAWNAAVDAYPSNPVTYDLYLATTNSAAAVFAGPPIAADLTGTGATVTGLVDGTSYYLGVRAKDNWVTKNVTANTDISGGVMPGAAPPTTPTSKVYYLTAPASATLLWGSVNTNLSLTCGTATTDLAVSAAAQWAVLPSPATPPAGRGLLTPTKTCGTASTNNFMAPNATAWPYVWRNIAGFYTAPYTYKTVVTGSATGNSFGFQGQATYPQYDYVLVLFSVVDSSGNHVADTGRYVAQYALTSAMAAYSLNLSSLSVTVPAGNRLALLFYYYDYGIGNLDSTIHRIAYDNYSAAITNQLSLNETILDTFPPTWPGGLSGIAAQDAGTDGVLQVSWNTATDPGMATTPPVLYDLYRVQNAACTGLWDSLNLYRFSLGSTSFQDSGLTNGLTYCYGVRAKDSANPQNYTSNDSQTASATPSRGAEFGCNSCHASPPTSAGNAGNHAAHANNDPDFTECNNCHPGTISYTNSHQDGAGQLAFDGTAATAVYNGNQLSYTDNAQVIYNDTNGYGILTGSAGDGVDNGTCAGTPANYCHGAATPSWGGTATCSSCHNGGGGTLAPVVTMASPHITAPGGASSCKDCHAGHFKGVRIPLPPASWSNANMGATNMRAQLGIGYTNAGGIYLGGPGTVASINTRATESEICWGCHDVVGTPVSEWGYNTKTTPAGFPVTTFATADGNPETENHGWIYSTSSYATKTSDWTQGYWMSAYDPLLKRRVASVHTANLDPAGQSSSVAANVRANGTVNRTSPTLENKGTIRCSYCHDVHDTFGPSGKPYLRGTWVGDPYPPELPPRSTYAYTTGVDTSSGGKTPRGLSTARDKGGYFIDQNSNWPTKNAAMDDTTETSGLCTLCHGAGVDTMDYYDGSKLWLAGMTNGHSNSCLGGNRSAPADLFTGNRYGCGMGMQGCIGGIGGCDSTYPQYQCSVKWCPPSGCTSIVNSGWYWGSAGGNPVGTFGGSGGGDYANWYGVGTFGGADGTGSKAHAFTCSKCHSPHATGLPALLIQNCIDPSLGSFSVGGQSGVNSIANNCHRKTSTADGWHILAPGQ